MNKKKRPTHVERVAAVLADNEWHTSAELYHRTRSVVHSRISDLRKRGHLIEHRRTEGNDAGSYEYRLLSSDAAGRAA
jgi:hypothetical protein